MNDFINHLDNLIKNHEINLTEEEVLDFLKMNRRFPYRYPWGQPSVEIISNFGTNQSGHFFNSRLEFMYDVWFDYFKKGFTTIIANILDLNKELRLLENKLKDVTGLPINGNFYFSRPGQRASFPSHKHDYDVIVKQIYGVSDWIINEKKITLQPSETCIIPKGMLHEVISKKTNKLSLTINLE